MDVENTLSELRALVALRQPIDVPNDQMTYRFARAFRDLDAHLSGGGRPPEAWREGPDAPELDDDTYPWCYLCDKVFGRGRDRERDEHLRTAHTADPLGGPVPGVNGWHLPDPDDVHDPSDDVADEYEYDQAHRAGEL